MQVFSVTWSFRNYFNMLICSSWNISYYYQCWTQLCCFIFLWKPWYIFFRILWLKEQHFISNIINVFTVTLDQFNVFLLNKNIDFFQIVLSNRLNRMQKKSLSTFYLYIYKSFINMNINEFDYMQNKSLSTFYIYININHIYEYYLIDLTALLSFLQMPNLHSKLNGSLNFTF